MTTSPPEDCPADKENRVNNEVPAAATNPDQNSENMGPQSQPKTFDPGEEETLHAEQEPWLPEEEEDRRAAYPLWNQSFRSL